MRCPEEDELTVRNQSRMKLKRASKPTIPNMVDATDAVEQKEQK